MSKIVLLTLAAIVSSGFISTVSAETPTGSAAGAWIRNGAADTSSGTLIEQGKAVFHNRCSGCHGEPGFMRPDGSSDMPGTSAILFKYKGNKPGKLEDWNDLTPELVRYFVRNGSMFMPAFRKTYVSDKELDALAVYLSNPEK